MNKGLKQEEYMDPETIERTKATRFKKGNKPDNTKYDGAISVRHMDAGDHHIPYKFIRISEGEWVLYHRHIWEKEHRAIPEGMILAFRDGDQMNCSLENLELITMEENMRRNSIMRYPEELRTSMRTLGKLKKKIKNATKQNH